MKRRISAIIMVLCLLLSAGCAKTADSETTAPASSAEGTAPEDVKIETTITEDTKYNAAILSITPEDFEAAGFTLGDSCDVKFENGPELSGVPFYDGYYVKNGSPVIVNYPNSGSVLITYNNTGIWSAEGLTEGEKVTVTLKEKGAFNAIQSTLSQVYSTDRSDYDSDESFCNFRAISAGNLKENFLFRGASPVDNSRNRAAYTDSLLEKNGIKFILDLADSEEDMKGYIAAEGFSSPYAESIYESGNTALLDMGSGFTTDEYRQKVAAGLRQMMNSEGPVYIHCMEGKDRTGFVCFLIEALAGATYDELLNDYMTTYANYYGVTKDGTPEKYQAIAELYFDSFVACLLGTDDLGDIDEGGFSTAAAEYLTSGGMTADEIAQLTAFICK